MEKIAFALLLPIVAIVAMVTPSHSEYSITQLTDDYHNGCPLVTGHHINNNGYVVWLGYDGSYNQIFLYDGTSVRQLTNSSYENWIPQINNNGYVVWEGAPNHPYYWEIFLYDGTSISQLTNNSCGNTSPQINNNGYVVWESSLGPQIFLYDGTSVRQLTNNSYETGNTMSPHINDKGQVVWREWDGSQWQIFLYDGTSVRQLTNNSYDKSPPKINNNGYVVWNGYDGSYWQIFLYNGISTIQLTNDSFNSTTPEINDRGQVVWWGRPNVTSEIFFYDGMSTRQLTNNSYDDSYPQINNNGQIVWIGIPDGPYTDWGIFLYDGISIMQILNDSFSNEKPLINDKGYVAWAGSRDRFNPCWEIFLATPNYPHIDVTPTSLDFSSINVGNSSALQTFTITNTGTADLHISGINLSDTTNYFLNVNGGTSPCGSTTPTITPDGNCTVTITFNPKSKGHKEATLTINSDDPDTPTLDVPLSGTGIPKVECNLVPDWPIVVQGGTLGFQGTVTNNTDEIQIFKYATRITLPSGNKYPYAGYLIGPIEVTLNPHQIKSKHLSQRIPHYARLGTYTYHSYVGVTGPPVIKYDECTFNFTVNSQGQGCNLCHQ